MGISFVLQCFEGLFRETVRHHFFLHIFFLCILGSQSDLSLCGSKKIRSGKLTRSSLKGFFCNRVLFAYTKCALCKHFSPLRCRAFISLEKGKLVFQKCLSETPFKPDRVSFCTPQKRLVIYDRRLSKMCKWTRPFWGTDCRRAPKSLSSAQAVPSLQCRH